MATTRLFTVHDLEGAPPAGDWELIDGELVPVNPTSFRSSIVAARIVRIVGIYVDERDLGEVTGADGGFVLFPDRETLLAPGVGFIHKERIPPEEEQNRFARLAPDLVVEVLSPTDRRPDALAKVAMYLQAGVQIVWLVDPAKRLVTVFQPDNAIVTLSDGDILDGGDLLPGFGVPVTEIFP